MTPIIFAPLIVLVGVASSSPIYRVPLTYVAFSPIPENIYNQVQDTRSGEYAFGYAGGPVAREEARTSDGVTRGSYSYVDAHGIVQHYQYVADDDGFRVVGTNIPTDADVASKLKAQQQLEAANIGAIDAENLLEKSQEIASSRKKRSAIYDHVPFETVNALLPAAPPAVVAAASVPTATSSQSRVQIYRSLRTEIHDPIEAIPIESVAALPATPLGVHSVAVAASVPTSTSSQSRYQVHNSLKTELHEPIHAIPIETIAQVPETPITLKSIEAIHSTIPVEIAASVPTSTSSQSRYQVHNSLKTELHEPVHAIPIETIAQVLESPVAVRSFKAIDATIPIEIAPFVPISTSSQSRYQVHNSLKTELFEPVHAVPIETIARVPETPVAVNSIEAIHSTIPVEFAASVPTSTSSQSRYQVHNSLKTELLEPVHAVPIETIVQVPETPIAVKSIEAIHSTIPVEVAASVPISTSSQSRYQVHNSLKTELLEPVHAVPIETIARVPETPVAVKSIEAIHSTIPVEIAASVPTSTSSQSRYQVHNSLKTELHEPVQATFIKTVAAAVPEPLPAVPVALESIEAIHSTIPVEVAASVPTSTSSQSRYQVHNSLKTELHEPVQASLIETVAAAVPEPLPAVPVALKSIEAIPSSPIVVAAASVPTSTSSQQRFQIHDSLESLNHESTDEIPTSVEIEYVYREPLVDAIPADTRTIFSIPATTTSITGSVSTPVRRNFQVYNNAQLELDDLSRSSEHELVDYKVRLRPAANEFSLPSLARHQIGFDLDIVSSPLVAYH